MKWRKTNEDLCATAFNIFTDVLFATIPIPIIWILKMSRKVRLYLIGILSLGYVSVSHSSTLISDVQAGLLVG